MIRIYGASDDLVEVEGDISEEFSFYGESSYLAVSDGTVLRVDYDRDGIWRFTRVSRGKSRLVHTIQTIDDPERGYSDVIHLFDDGLPEEDKIRWVVFGSFLAVARR
jgi:hypothetical protein